MSKSVVDITGNVYGSLLVIGRAEKPPDLLTDGVYWLCKCSNCGSTTAILGKSLRNGSAKYCGCKRKSNTRGAPVNSIKINRLLDGQSNFNQLYLRYKKSAEYRGYQFLITPDDFRSITSSDCHYCGAHPSQVIDRKQSNGAYVYNGIDRKDNAIGYTIENALPCCGLCNYKKGDMDYKDFVEWIERVSRNLFN